MYFACQFTFTPPEYIEAARAVMGMIDLDPASCPEVNRTVLAGKYYTAESDGLTHPWSGNIWLNPPYSGKLIGKFMEKLVEERPNYNQAIILVNNATETKWFDMAVGISSAVVFPRGRIKFHSPSGKKGTPLQGQAILYVGDKSEVFIEVFPAFGWAGMLR